MTKLQKCMRMMNSDSRILKMAWEEPRHLTLNLLKNRLFMEGFGLVQQSGEALFRFIAANSVNIFMALVT